MGSVQISWEAIKKLVSRPFRGPGRPGIVVAPATSTGLVLEDSGNWVAAGGGGGGDITAVIAGDGLTGGATSGAATLDVDFGTTAGTVAEGNDPRLSDDRDPNAHAASHQHGGGDEVATATPGNNAIVKANGSGKLAAGWGGSASTLATLDSNAFVVEAVKALRETSGGTTLTIGAIADGQYGKRVGSTFVGGDPPGTLLVGLDSDEVSGSAVTTVSFGSLTTLQHGERWILAASIYNPTGGTVNYRLEYNTDTTLTNYYNQVNGSNDTTGLNGRNNNPTFAITATTARVNLECMIGRDQEGRTRARSHVTNNNASAIQIRDYNHIWNVTTDPTSIEIVADTASAIGIGSRFELYKRVRAT